MYHFSTFDNKTAISPIDLNCDFSFVLRSILTRGADEAHYRAFMSAGTEADHYKRISDWLHNIIKSLPAMPEEGTLLSASQRAILQLAVSLAREIIALEREETAVQFEMLSYRLSHANTLRSDIASQAI